MPQAAKPLRGEAFSDAGPQQGDKPVSVVVPRDFTGPTDSIKSVEGEQPPQPFARETVMDLVKRSAELLSMFDRELKYELKDDAGVVQMQVIDSRDGRVVRKIPSDEIFKFIEHIKSQIDDRVDVRA
jgi:uncharacterized FlaG/YvyC family protein